MNEWTELYRHIIKPDLRLLFGKAPTIKFQIEIKYDLGVIKNLTSKEIITKHLTRQMIIIFNILRDLSKENIKIDKRVFKVSKRKYISGVKISVRIIEPKLINNFLNILIQDEDKKIIQKGSEMFELSGLTPFNSLPYVKGYLDVESLKKIKLEINIKNKNNNLSELLLKLIGLPNE